MSKVVMEDCRTLSIYKIKEWGHLKGGHSWGSAVWTSRLSGKQNSISFTANIEGYDNNYIELDYTITDIDTKEETKVKHKYPLTSTPCHYGGQRYWFVCNVCNSNGYCGRRVANLYLGAGSKYFACRHCYDLTYRSKLEGSFYSTIDLDEYHEKIGRYYYAGKITKKYKRYLEMEKSFMLGIIKITGGLEDI